MYWREKIEEMLNNKNPTNIKTWEIEEMIVKYKKEVEEMIANIDKLVYKANY